jgi:hypothetical protein
VINTNIIRGLGSSGTENRAKVFSFLNTWSDFLTVAVRDRLCHDLLLVVEAAADDIGDGQVALIARQRLVREIKLEKD